MPRYEPEIPNITSRRISDVPSGSAPACKVEAGPDRWPHYAGAYREAGNVLAEATQHGPFRRNILGAPILFCLRQYIELKLKSLLLDAGELLDEPQAVPPKHYLLSLWNRVRELLLQIDPSSEGRWLARADQIIADFDRLDPDSYCFRYPVDNAGSPALPTLVAYDPAVAKGIVDELAVLLEGAEAQIDHYMGFKGEGV